jgi:hypothetical protein
MLGLFKGLRKADGRHMSLRVSFFDFVWYKMRRFPGMPREA